MRHRKRGEGTVIARRRRRTDGSVQVYFETRASLGFDAKGKRRRKTFCADTVPKAVEKRNKWLVAHPGAKAFVEDSTILVRDYLDKWLDDAQMSKRPKTVEQRRIQVEYHLCPELAAAKAKNEKKKKVLLERTSIGHIQLNKLTPFHIQHLMTDVARTSKSNGERISARSVVLCYKVLNAALNEAVKRRQLEVNPCSGVDTPKSQSKEIEYFNEAEARKFMDAARNDRLYPLMALALGTGMRRGEVLGLQWADVDSKCRYVQVRRQLVLMDGRMMESQPKTKAGRRRIDLPAHIATILADHKKQSDGKWVFATDAGQPLNATAMVRNHFEKILTAAGLPHFSFHSLRHTMATLCLLKGVSPKVVQERLGHSNVVITLETYSHVLPSMQTDAAARLDEALF